MDLNSHKIHSAAESHPVHTVPSKLRAHTAQATHPVLMVLNSPRTHTAQAILQVPMALNSPRAHTAQAIHPVRMVLSNLRAHTDKANHPVPMVLNSPRAHTAQANHPVPMVLNSPRAHTAQASPLNPMGLKRALLLMHLSKLLSVHMVFQMALSLAYLVFTKLSTIRSFLMEKLIHTDLQKHKVLTDHLLLTARVICLNLTPTTYLTKKTRCMKRHLLIQAFTNDHQARPREVLTVLQHQNLCRRTPLNLAHLLQSVTLDKSNP